jgi:Family of unknown function (DUF6152)
MRLFKARSWIVIAFAALANLASAHHAANSQFDVNQNLIMTGVLTGYELINPHPYFHFKVKGADGTWTNWSFETGAPIMLKRAGLSCREVCIIGNTFKFVYSPSRDGSHTGLMTAITLPDGRLIALSAPKNVDAAAEELSHK